MKKVILKSLAKKVTEQNRFQLPQESFRLTSVEICFETESSRIEFNSLDGWHSISVFDKESRKSVSLNFFFDGEISVFVYFWKQKGTIAFWKKPILRIKKAINYDLVEDEEDIDENIKFVWDRIPEFLINLR